MSSDDRRSGEERRSTSRFPVEAEVEWEVAGERLAGTMSDVSFEGCFVMAGGEVANGTPVRIYLPLDDGMKVQYTGIVANSVSEIGFGVQFDPLSVPQREVLVQLVKTFRKD
jgi:hypothetical protein